MTKIKPTKQYLHEEEGELEIYELLGLEGLASMHLESVVLRWKTATLIPTLALNTNNYVGQNFDAQ